MPELKQFFFQTGASDNSLLFGVDPTISSYSLLTKKPASWRNFILQASLEIIKEKNFSLNDIRYILTVIRDYIVTISDNKESRLIQQINRCFFNPDKMVAYLNQINFKCDNYLSLVDDLESYIQFSNLLFHSWLQNKFHDQLPLLQQLESGRLKLQTRMQERLSSEFHDSLFLLDALEKEHSKGLF
ncbi:MAG: hypothetical protein CK426_01665 [Legionella sp.]|nr:MAG: hypothetical protein CK423_04765 [Legionella sp.]PJD99778.1 MAG: hypothetical protein CK426_01665 [Legionella sp.]